MTSWVVKGAGGQATFANALYKKTLARQSRTTQCDRRSDADIVLSVTGVIKLLAARKKAAAD